MIEQDKIAKSTGIVSSATFLSRVLGLVREQVFAFLFGAGYATDAFIAAFRIPNLLRDLFAEGALSSAFIPVFTDHKTNQGKEKAWELANLVLNLLLVTLCLVIILGIIFAPYIVSVIAPGFGKEVGKQDLTTLLSRIMFPFLLLIALAALAMGMLNTFRRFGIPALAPTLFNLGMITGGLFISPLFDPPIIGMALGVLLGGFGQVAIQLPSLRKIGFRYRFTLNLRHPAGVHRTVHPGVKRILILMVPATLGLASTQINIFVNTLIASLLPQGSVSYLNYSFRLMQFPIGVFGVAVATVTFPIVSAFAAKKEMGQVVSTFTSSLKLVFFLTIPSAVFLAVASQPVISVLFQHGRFTHLDTVATSQALMFYCIGLFAYSSVRLTASTFYSMGDTKTPAKTSAVAVGVNIILNLILMHPLGFRGLALAASVAAMTNLGLLLMILDKRIGPLDQKDITMTFLKILSSAVFMGLALWVYLKFFGLDLRTAPLAEKILSLAIILILGLLSYSAFSYILRVKELDRILELLKIRKKKG
ncbi:MAG: murein biosynthesis integral membrane protein MurJ [candidate division Zixibacteria bacterium]|nr:murein biosynthesis integral membrane protein MurJ [candidate division Zixibacteria bacterium]